MLPASHRRLIRRRLLRDLSAPSLPKQMKKKKPKKSPAKPFLKSSPPAKSNSSPTKSNSPPTKSNPAAIDPLLEDTMDGSDAQIGGPAAAVAHHSMDASDPHPVSDEVKICKTVIVAPPTDPSSVCDKEVMKVVPESSSEAPLAPTTVESEGSPNALIIMSELSSAAPLDFSKMDSESVKASKDVVNTSVSPLLATADAKTGSLRSQSAIDSKDATNVVKIHDSGALSVSSDRLVSDTITILEAHENDLQKLQALVNAQQEAVLNSGSEATETMTAKGTSVVPLKHSRDPAPADDWCARAKGIGKRLSKKGEAFTLPSGEACIKIPNFVIEKNRKSWEPFVLGQFYSDPPPQGTLHNIVNGIWSKHYRDIAVSKLEGFAFLFRIPNAATRHRVITQGLWQIEGQTMFVDKWEPGVIPAKPELTSAPIWLELRNVPFQFFNEDGLERIAGLVGHPKFLHPATANKTNLEVAKVFTVIDPRKPLPEAVNVQFDSGDISRVLLSSPWMPPVCGFCKEVGHVTKRCPTAPKACSFCNSLSHVSGKCPQKPQQEPSKKKTRRGRSKDNQHWRVVDPPAVTQKSLPSSAPTNGGADSY